MLHLISVQATIALKTIPILKPEYYLMPKRSALAAAGVKCSQWLSIATTMAANCSSAGSASAVIPGERQS